MSSKNNKHIERMIAESLAIEETSALDAGSLGFMARALVQATMPHRNTEETRFIRSNGDYSLEMVAMKSGVGLPYGSMPRLVLAWMGTEAVRTQERKLVLGDNMTAFMRQLGLESYGGRWGTITRLKEQTRRLLNCGITCSYTREHDNASNEGDTKMLVADATDMWWPANSKTAPNQSSLFKSTVTLSERFFNEIIAHPIPVDMRVLKQLKRSPMALDIYAWLTWRMSYLSKETTIPWQSLQAQFGAGYPATTRGKLDFKARFSKHLKDVLLYYPDAKVDSKTDGLTIKPSLTHISPPTTPMKY